MALKTLYLKEMLMAGNAYMTQKIGDEEKNLDASSPIITLHTF